MTWFFIALAAPALWSAGNHIDKLLLGKYLQHAGIPTLTIFSSLIGIVVATSIAVWHPHVLAVPWASAVAMMANGAVYVLGLYPYLLALQRDEASVVAPLFQLIPVFIYVLSFFCLGEQLGIGQVLACLVVLVGAVLLSVETGQERFRLKKGILGLMFTASFLLALNAVAFKHLAHEQSFWTARFWESVGLTLVGLGILAFIKRYRQQFFAVIKTNPVKVISLNALNEFINMGALIAISYAGMLAPLALVQTVTALQPFFVFIYGIILSFFFAHVGKETLARRQLVQKAVSISLLVWGSYSLFL